MAERKKRATASTTGKKAVAKPRGATENHERQSPAKKRAKANAQQVLAGFEILRKAAVDELSEGGEKIARKLRQKSEAGDTPSTKLLIELALKPKQAKGAGAESVALQIAGDREWLEKAEKAHPADQQQQGSSKKNDNKA